VDASADLPDIKIGIDNLTVRKRY